MLNQEHINFLKTFQISAEKTSQDWLYFFEDFKKGYEKRVKNLAFFRHCQVILVLLFIALLIFGEELISNDNYLNVSLAGIFAIWIWVRIEMARNKTSENTRFLIEQINYFIEPLLNILAEDVKQNTLINLQLDLRDRFATSEFKKNTYKHNGWNVSFYSLVALKLRAILEDKIILDFIISDKFKKMDRQKQSVSGKTKWKYKFKGKTTYIAKVGFPKEKFSSVEQLAEKKDKVVKVSKAYQINLQEKYGYQTKKAIEAIANAFASMKKVA